MILQKEIKIIDGYGIFPSIYHQPWKGDEYTISVKKLFDTKEQAIEYLKEHLEQAERMKWIILPVTFLSINFDYNG